MLLLAAPSVAYAIQAPLVSGGFDVQIWPAGEAGQTVVITSVHVPEDVDLPVTVRIPTVAGMNIQWVGEISGPDPSQDPTRTFTIDSGEGGEYAEFEVTTYRLAQIEMLGLPLGTDAGRTSVTVPWVQSVPSTITAFSVRAPAGATDVRLEPVAVGAPSSNQAGESLYTLPSQQLQPGDRTAVTVSYKAGGGVPDAPSASDGTWVIGALAVGIVIALLLLAWLLQRGRHSQIDD